VTDLAIGQVARGAEVGVQTVRYYERRGLLPPPTRRHSGRRTYTSDIVDLLRAVTTAQRPGFTLVEIEEILRLSAGKATGSSPLRDRVREKVLEIDVKIANLCAIRERLAAALHAGCDSLTKCTCPAGPLFAEHGNEESPLGQR
jgi:DNA-binding transcriptional MerR regulator